MYVCSYHRDRASSVCANKLLRPVEGTNDAVLAWVQKNVLGEELMLATLARIRARLKAGNQRTAADLPQLKGRVAKLTAEIQNLVDVMAVTPPAETAPEAVSLEVRRARARPLSATALLTSSSGS